MAAKALTKKQLDDPARWRAWDAWHDAQLWGALNGVFNLKEDKKAADAFARNDLKMVNTLRSKRLHGLPKMKFKKVPPKRIGQEAETIAGSRAHGAKLLEEKIFGKRKPPLKKTKSEKKKKPQVFVKRDSKPVSKPNPDLAQNNAYMQARKKAKKGETLLYIILVNPKTREYQATYGRAGKKIVRKITAVHVPKPDPWAEQMRRYAKRVKKYWDKKNGEKDGKKPAVRKAKPKTKDEKRKRY